MKETKKENKMDTLQCELCGHFSARILEMETIKKLDKGGSGMRIEETLYYCSSCKRIYKETQATTIEIISVKKSGEGE